MIKGSCLCGKVNYSIAGDLKEIINCHCPTCRKAHAAAFSSVVMVPLDDFHIESGEDLLKSYESSPGKQRHFCSNCGSQIYAYRQGQVNYVVRAGTLEGDPGCRPSKHIWVSQKAIWYDIHDELPQYEEFAD